MGTAPGGLVLDYANDHSRLAVEELCIRMGARTGFHPLLQAGFKTFTDVVGRYMKRGTMIFGQVLRAPGNVEAYTYP